MKKFWLLVGLGGCVAVSAIARDELAVSNTAIRFDQADALPKAHPEDVGMSSKRLRRIATAMQRHIDSQKSLC